MKKILWYLVVFLSCGLLLGGVCFLVLSFYYSNRFPVNLWVNGVYCTGKSVEQVNEELVSQTEASTVYVVDAQGKYWELDREAADIRPDYTRALSAYMGGDNLFYWWSYLWEPVVVELAAETYMANEEELRSCFNSISFVSRERERNVGVSLHYAEGGYYLRDNNAERMDCEKAFTYLMTCLLNGETVVDLREAECLVDLPDSADDMRQRKLWMQICEFMGKTAGITYDMGAESISLTPEILSGFLEKDQKGIPLLDDQGEFIISQVGVREWVEALALAYDTCDTEREFAATRGDLVKVKYVTYGTKLDTEAEVAFLFQILQSEKPKDQVHIPSYIRQGYVRGLDDIGGTYIEIDMTQQKMYYYADGVLILETDVVTGNTGRRMGTPEGINFAYNKERDRSLRGPGYASFVKYWMPVKGGVGIHDASWRSKFGGTIYKTNGSHGCINTPEDIMTQLYDMAEVGTPVIMFY